MQQDYPVPPPELIAKWASNNAVLQQFAAYQLQQFLDTADVVALDSGEDEPKTP